MAQPPYLVADVGGTNARFALADRSGELSHIADYAVARTPMFADMLRQYLDALPASVPRPRLAAIGVAARPDAVPIRLTNSPWSIDPEGLRREFSLQALTCLNDFVALAWSLPGLAGAHLQKIGGGEAMSNHPIGVLGPGTGLGVSGLIPDGSGWVALDGEGGHVGFAPMTIRELEILRASWREEAHTSMEDLISGGGLPRLLRAVAVADGLSCVSDRYVSAAAIHQAALANDPLARATLALFSELLGTAAAHLALTLGARGGIYLGGGVLPKLGALFDADAFRRRFETHDRFAGFLAAIPTWLVLDPHAALRGAAHALSRAHPLSAGGRSPAIR